MNISASYYSDIGGRNKNEDAVTILESGSTVLGIVADGLGGHLGGEIASKSALRTINARIAHCPVSRTALLEAIQAANSAILADPSHRAMKTTVAALWLDDRNALGATVGDTRIYQFRAGRILYQSIDHSAAQAAVYAGDITADEIRGSRERHKLTRALGAEEEVRADIVSLETAPGDAFLLCSDGFWELLQEKEMLSCLAASGSAGEWLKKMRGQVSARSDASSDNHSAVAIIIKQGD